MRYLLFCSFFVIALTLSAQTFTYGLKLGPSISQTAKSKAYLDFIGTAITSEASFERVFQYHAGAWATFQLGRGFKWQPELVWTQQAHKPEDRNNDAYIELNYLSLPLLFSYEMLPQLSIAIGPQFSYLLAQRMRKSELSGPNPYIDEFIKDFAVSGDLEIGYQLNRFRLGLRAQHDLTPFMTFNYTDVNGEAVGLQNFYNQSLSFWIGYALR